MGNVAVRNEGPGLKQPGTAFQAVTRQTQSVWLKQRDAARRAVAHRQGGEQKTRRVQGIGFRKHADLPAGGVSSGKALTGPLVPGQSASSDAGPSASGQTSRAEQSSFAETQTLTVSGRRPGCSARPSHPVHSGRAIRRACTDTRRPTRHPGVPGSAAPHRKDRQPRWRSYPAFIIRRRSTEEGIRKASRYLATVRRAMSMPASFRISTMRSSDRTSPSRASWSIIDLIR